MKQAFLLQAFLFRNVSNLPVSSYIAKNQSDLLFWICRRLKVFVSVLKVFEGVLKDFVGAIFLLF